MLQNIKKGLFLLIALLTAFSASAADFSAKNADKVIKRQTANAFTLTVKADPTIVDYIYVNSSGSSGFLDDEYEAMEYSIAGTLNEFETTDWSNFYIKIAIKPEKVGVKYYVKATKSDRSAATVMSLGDSSNPKTTASATGNVLSWSLINGGTLEVITIEDHFSAINADGTTIYYNTTSIEPLTVEVTNNSGNSNTYSGNVNIPKTVTHNGKEYSVTAIGERAFYLCRDLSSVTIPESVTSIGNSAFYQCSSLTAVTIPESATSIESSTFYGCSRLTSVTIPNSVTSIGSYAFFGCYGLTSVTIPNSVTSIGDSAFSSCSRLTSVTIPNSVTSIESSVFYGCSDLTSVTIPNSVTSIGNSAFSKCTGLTSVTIPNSVTSIESYAFYGCSGLTSVTIPNSAISIGSYAFYNCSGFTSVTIGESVTSIGDGVFYGCSRLTTVNFNAANCTQMGSSSYPAFSGCTSVTTLNIGEKVQSIPSYAFYNCVGLNTIQCSAIVPPTLGEKVFYGVNKSTCDLLVPDSSLDDYKNAEEWKEFYNQSVGDIFSKQNADGVTIYYRITSSTEPYTVEVTNKSGSSASNYSGNVNIPETVTYKNKTYSVTAIGYAFSGCSGLTSVTIPSSVTSIVGSAFSGCESLTTVNYNATNCTQMGSKSWSGTYLPAFSECTSLTTLNIGENVQSIPDYAFRGCEWLTTVNFNAANCTQMGSSSYPAFSECLNLTTLNIGENVQTIPNYAFYGCSGLTSVTIPYSVTSIGSYAFFGCWRLTSVTIPNSVTAIGEEAFYQCSSLTSVTIPESVTSIGSSAFYGCSGLTSVNYNSVNCTQMSSYNYPLFKGCYSLKTLTIGDKVQAIPDYAFYTCNGLTSVTIGGSVRSIGVSAFRGCSGMTSINIPNSVTSIGSSAFSGCSGLTSVTIPNSVTSIGDGVFYGCSGLTSVTIPNSVTSIGSSAFSKCTGLTSVTIPESVTFIGQEAFYYCSGLRSLQCDAIVPPTLGENVFYGVCKPNCIIIVADGSLEEYKKADQWRDFYNNPGIDDIFFAVNNDGIAIYYQITSLAPNTVKVISANNKYSGDINIPNSVSIKGDTYSVTSIGSDAFSNCSGLTSVTIPNSVTSIGNYAFEGCGLTTINYNATNCTGSSSYPVFYGCTHLITLNIGENVQSIPDYAFRGCEWLTTVNFNATNCTKMGSSSYPAFSRCSSLTTLNIGENVQTIPSYAFKGSGLTTVNFNATNCTQTGYSAFSGCTKLNTLNIGENVQTIPNSAFEGCSGLTSVTIPESVTSIGSSAFSGCSGLTSINIPDAVTKIESGIFSGCSKLTSINIPDAVTSIGSYAFSGCTGLTSVTIPESVTSIGSSAFSKCTGLTSVTIPEKVTYIGSSAFSNCTGLTSVTIPESVTSIGSSAFYGCSVLTSITIPNSVTSIESYAFKDCSRLTSVTIGESVTSISDGVFYGCSGLTTVNFNATNCTQMGSSSYPAFSGCTSVTTLNIGEKVQSIPDYALYGCSGLTTVNFNATNCTQMGSSSLPVFSECSQLSTLTIGENVKTIPDYAFYGCSGLTSVTIPNAVKSIGKEALYGCSGLTSVTIGGAVEKIGASAFAGCTELKTVRCDNPTPPALGTTVFASEIHPECELIVPDGSVNSYKIADQWKDFSDVSIMDNFSLINADGIRIYYKITSFTEPYTVEVTYGEIKYAGDVNIPETVTYIGKTYIVESIEDSAFNGCSGLTSVTIPNSMTTIGEYAFCTCRDLTCVNIGASVTKISTCAFYLCENLATVINNSSLNIVKGSETHGYVAYYAKDVIQGTTSNKFEIENAEVHAGKTLLLPVKMSNEESIVSFSCDVVLPEGLTLAKDEYDDYDITLADRCDGTHVITSSDLDGKIRVVEYSSKNHPFTGNEGTIFYLPIVAADDLESDTELTVKITNIYLTEAETFNEMRSPDVKATLTIKPPFTPGDVNDDGKFSVADVSLAVEFVLGHEPTQGFAEAADANGDGRVSVADVSIIVSYVLSGKVIDAVGPARIMSDTQELAVEQLAYCGGEANWAKIGLTNASDYTAAQFDIVLPEGVTVADVRLSNQGASHQAMFSELENGRVRVLAYSPTNANFSDGQSFIEIQLNGFADGDMVITNASVVRNDGDSITELTAEGCVISNVISAINGMGADELIIGVENCNIVIIAPESTTVRFSDTLGRSSAISVKAGRNVIPVVPGIYFVNNKKLVIR